MAIKWVSLLRSMSNAMDDLSPNESVGVFSGSGVWIELATVEEIREAEKEMLGYFAEVGEESKPR